jgi:hypothetical protein
VDIGRVIAVLSLAHDIGDYSKGVKIICSVKRQRIAFRNPLLRLDLLSDRSEFFWNELVIHRQTLLIAREACTEGWRVATKTMATRIVDGRAAFFWQVLLCANV